MRGCKRNIDYALKVKEKKDYIAQKNLKNYGKGATTCFPHSNCSLLRASQRGV